ncbi:MAG: hypothetical protein WBV89_17440, partial [Ilumatobacter sp.]
MTSFANDIAVAATVVGATSPDAVVDVVDVDPAVGAVVVSDGGSPLGETSDAVPVGPAVSTVVPSAAPSAGVSAPAAHAASTAASAAPAHAVPIVQLRLVAESVIGSVARSGSGLRVEAPVE